MKECQIVCANLIFANGCVIESVGDLRKIGVIIDADQWDTYCLCGVDVASIIKNFTNTWGHDAFDFIEIGPDGQTWEQGYAPGDPVPGQSWVDMYRPDGREPTSLEEFAAQIESGEYQLFKTFS